MLYWYRDLLIGEKMKKNPEKYMKKIEKHYQANPNGKIFGKKKPPIKEFFVVVRAGNPDNLFEVMGTRQWFFKHYSKTDIYIIGMFQSEDEALEAIQSMLSEGYTGDPEYDPRGDYWDDEGYGQFVDVSRSADV